MSVALRSSFGAWWIRLFHRMGHRPQAPSVAEIPPAQTTPPREEAAEPSIVPEPRLVAVAEEAEEPKIDRRAINEELAQSFAQTVVAAPPPNASVLTRE